MTVRIHEPRIQERDEWVRVSFQVEGLAAPELWFDIEADQRHLISETAEPALTSLLPAAMAEGAPVRVEGPVSARLLWHIRNTVVPVVTRQRPFLSPVPIDAPGRTSEWEKRGTGVLTGFSCGVDSLSAIQDHYFDETVPQDEKVTHFIFISLGNHGYGPDTHARVAHRWERIKKAASEFPIPIFRLYSNLPDFYPDQHDSRLNWAAALTVRNSAVPLLLQRGIRRFLFASSHSFRVFGVYPTSDMTKADPVLLPALGTERTELCSVGTEHTRVEKTRRIAPLEITRMHLDVCIMEGDRNCSRCEKCMRTLLALELDGCIDAFKDRFDLEVYRNHRDEFIARVWADTQDDYHLELQEFMKEKGVTPPAKARVMAHALQTWRLIPEDIRRKIRGMEAKGE